MSPRGWIYYLRWLQKKYRPALEYLEKHNVRPPVGKSGD